MERRNTVQKQLVLDAVRSLKNHPTAEEVYMLISKDHPSVSKGTVYRNLNILSCEKQILKIEIPNGPDHFDHTLNKHFHMNCINCKKVEDVSMDEMDMSNLIHDNGHLIMDYDIIFKGICCNCLDKKEV